MRAKESNGEQGRHVTYSNGDQERVKEGKRMQQKAPESKAEQGRA